MVKKMSGKFCKRGKDGPRQHVTKDGSIMDNRPSVSKFYFQIQPISVCTDLRGS